jgi:hypothetical protein
LTEDTGREAVREYDSDPDVFRYRRHGPNTLEQSRERIARAIARHT